MTIVMGDATMTELTGLMIFTNYSISVQAETVEPGDPSETITVTTDEDCEFYVGDLYTDAITWSSYCLGVVQFRVVVKPLRKFN